MYVIVFDFDSTLVSVEALDELFAASIADDPAGEARVAEFRRITDQGMAGEISAEASLARRLAVLRADRRLVERVAVEISGRLTPSVERQLPFFRENAGRIHVLSGGFEELILPTLARIGIPAGQLQAHRFSFDPEGRLTGLDPGTAMAVGGKPAAVRAVPRDRGPVWMVGDGATDLELRALGLVDRFVAFTENRHRDPVVAGADAVAASMEELIGLLARR